jgi:hypothetical protein
MKIRPQSGSSQKRVETYVGVNASDERSSKESLRKRSQELGVRLTTLKTYTEEGIGSKAHTN